MMDPQPTISSQEMIPNLKKQKGLYILNQWIFERAKSFIRNGIIEIVPDDISETICSQNDITGDALNLDLSDPIFSKTNANMLGIYNTVISLYMAEQAIRQNITIENCINLLAPEGHLIVILPARTAVYNELKDGRNSSILDNRLFIKKSLDIKLKIVKTRYFILSNSPTEPTNISENNNTEIPIFNLDINIPHLLIGLNTIVVVKK